MLNDDDILQMETPCNANKKTSTLTITPSSVSRNGTSVQCLEKAKDRYSKFALLLVTSQLDMPGSGDGNNGEEEIIYH